MLVSVKDLEFEASFKKKKKEKLTNVEGDSKIMLYHKENVTFLLRKVASNSSG